MDYKYRISTEPFEGYKFRASLVVITFDEIHPIRLDVYTDDGDKESFQSLIKGRMGKKTTQIGIDNWFDYVKQDERYMRPAEVNLLLGDYSKIKEKLGWEPKTDFNTLVKMMVENDINLLSGENKE